MAIPGIQNFDLSNLANVTGVGSGPTASSQKPFDLEGLISKGVDSVNRELTEADKISQEFLTGQKHELHEVMISLEKADLSFRFMTQIRNKVLDAYNDIMRMPV